MRAVSDSSAWCEHVRRARPQQQDCPPSCRMQMPVTAHKARPGLHQGAGAGGAPDGGS